ncbi:MAG TPA: phosphoribosylanthranilate isomerase [Stellaceae bacterium]|nr:phosphoribosylanthranilate isomerase [Stellaceae bacterium]
MTLAIKICGLNSEAACAVAIAGGARYLGFVFFPPSPRNLTPAKAASLGQEITSGITRVGVFVDADDRALAAVLDLVPLDLLQFHGEETPARLVEVKRRFGLPVMKAIKVRNAADLEGANDYVDVADLLMFDALSGGTLPGGNGRAFDWRLLRGRNWPLPWMLSGGLTSENVAEAVRISGARAVDVSSGVESRPGVKDPAKIAAFLAAGLAVKEPARDSASQVNGRNGIP